MEMVFNQSTAEKLFTKLKHSYENSGYIVVIIIIYSKDFIIFTNVYLRCNYEQAFCLLRAHINVNTSVLRVTAIHQFRNLVLLFMYGYYNTMIRRGLFINSNRNRSPLSNIFF